MVVWFGVVFFLGGGEVYKKRSSPPFQRSKVAGFCCEVCFFSFSPGFLKFAFWVRGGGGWASSWA